MIIPNCHLPGNELLDRIDGGSQVYLSLSEEISAHLFGDQSGVVEIEEALAGNLHAAIIVLERCRPGWEYKINRGHRSDNVWLVPGWYHPQHGETLVKLVGEYEPGSVWDHGVDVDLRPSRGAYPGAAVIAAIVVSTNLLQWLDADKTDQKRRGQRYSGPRGRGPYETPERQQQKKSIRRRYFGSDDK